MRKLFILLALFSATSFSAFAQNANQLGKDEQTSAAPVSEDIRTLELGCQMARYGYANKSASALIEAARMIGSIATQPATDEHSEVGEGQPNDGKKRSSISYDPEQILKDARKYAGKDKSLLALADQVESSLKTAHRGAIVGPYTVYDRVLAHSTDTWTCTFRGGESARVVVEGDGDTDLDLYIYDENGNLVDSDTDRTDYCIGTWTPRWTGKFTIKIKNLGSVYNRYRYYHN